MKNVLL